MSAIFGSLSVVRVDYFPSVVVLETEPILIAYSLHDCFYLRDSLFWPRSISTVKNSYACRERVEKFVYTLILLDTPSI